MNNNAGGILRTTGLVVMIVCAVISTALLFIFGEIWWGCFWSCVILLVGAFEIAAYITNKKTISTMYKEFIQKHPVIGRLIIGLFAIALLGLWVHLLVW